MRLAVTYAEELGTYGITGVALSPGWLRSESMLEDKGVTEDNWQDWYWDDPDRNDPAWLSSQSPRYSGRAVVALAIDPERSRWNGRTVSTDVLAGEYGFTDVNGTRPGHGKYDWQGGARPRREDYP